MTKPEHFRRISEKSCSTCKYLNGTARITHNGIEGFNGWKCELHKFIVGPCPDCFICNDWCNIYNRKEGVKK